MTSCFIFNKFIKQKCNVAFHKKTHTYKHIFSKLKLTRDKKYSTFKPGLNKNI